MKTAAKVAICIRNYYFTMVQIGMLEALKRETT